MNNKSSFSLIEIILVIFLISIALKLTLSTSYSKLTLAKNQLILHLKYLRYIAFNDNKFRPNDDKFHKKFWTFKIQRCNNNSGFYYLIYSDKNKNSYISKTESLKDPLTNKYIYNYSKCVENEFDKLANTLLSKTFGIKKIEISCNKTSSIGQLSFDNQGNVFTKLPKYYKNLDNFKLKKNCYINFSDGKYSKTITITKNGYIF